MQKPKALYYYDWSNSYIPNILKEIYMDRVYRPYIEHLKDGVFLDLGCNIGLWSIYASKYASKIYSFEPAEETFKLATANLAEEDAFKKVELFQMAVSNEDGEASFFRNTNSTMNSMKEAVSNQPEATTKVPTIRLDTFVKDQGITHIDFAKIDVEGSEDVLFASEGFEKIVPILDAFVYEHHSWSNSSAEQINRHLEDLGYKMTLIPSEATIYAGVKIK